MLTLLNYILLIEPQYSRGWACPCPISVKVRKTGQGKGEKADKEMPV